MTDASIELLGWAGHILPILGLVLILAHPWIQKGLASNSNSWWAVFGNHNPVSPNFNTIKSLAYICIVVGLFCLFVFFNA